MDGRDFPHPGRADPRAPQICPRALASGHPPSPGELSRPPVQRPAPETNFTVQSHPGASASTLRSTGASARIPLATLWGVLNGCSLEHRWADSLRRDLQLAQSGASISVPCRVVRAGLRLARGLLIVESILGN